MLTEHRMEGISTPKVFFRDSGEKTRGRRHHAIQPFVRGCGATLLDVAYDDPCKVATAFQVTGEFFHIGILRYRMSLAESHAAKRIEEEGFINEGKHVKKASAPGVLLHQRREYSAGWWKFRRKPLRESADATMWISMKTLRPRRDEDSLVIVRVGKIHVA